MPTDATHAPECSHAPYRSWGEVQIAAALARHSIPFNYEQPVAVVDSGRTRIWYPDFTLRNLGIHLEYCGRRNDPAYGESMKQKRRMYEANGVTALMFTPEFFRENWQDRLREEVHETLVKRVADFEKQLTNNTGQIGF